MTRITKGTEVYLILDWDHKATVSVRRMTVTSFGKQRGTAVYTEGGATLKMFIEPELVGNRLFAVADVADIDLLAQDMAAAQKARWIKHFRDTQHGYLDAADSYHAAMKRRCEAVMAATPTVVSR